jgi:hypothetical protein
MGNFCAFETLQLLHNMRHGTAIAQVIRRQIPIEEAEFYPRLGHVGFVVDKVALGQVFSEYFVFQGQFSFPETGTTGQ